MDNQHRKITGYRDLTQDEIDLMNAIKTVGADVGRLVDAIAADATFDARWTAIARTHLQEGFMALTRAVAKPDSF